MELHGLRGYTCPLFITKITKCLFVLLLVLLFHHVESEIEIKSEQDVSFDSDQKLYRNNLRFIFSQPGDFPSPSIQFVELFEELRYELGMEITIYFGMKEVDRNWFTNFSCGQNENEQFSKNLVFIFVDDGPQLLNAVSKVALWYNTSERMSQNSRLIFVIYANGLEESDFKIIEEAGILSIPITSDLYVVEKNTLAKPKETFEAIELYNLDGVTISNTINFVSLAELNSKWGRRMNLRGIEVTALAADDPQTVYEKHGDQIVLKSGIGADVFNYFKDALNFSPRVIVENEWPKQVPNGSWVGMGKYLEQGTADIDIVFTTFLPLRAKHFMVLVPHLRVPLVAAFVQPDWATIRNVYVAPFEWQLWVGYAMLLIGLCVILIVVLSRTKVKGKKYRNIHLDMDIPSWMISFMCLQGWCPLIKKDEGAAVNTSASIKIICLILVPFSTLIVSNFYKANLYKFLFEEIVPIKTLTELLQSDFYLVADKGSQAVLGLMEHPEKFSWENKEISNLLRRKTISIKLLNDGVSDISSGGALVTYVNSIYTENKRTWKLSDLEICGNDNNNQYGQTYPFKLSIIPFTIPYSTGMMAPKNSKYKDLFNIQMVTLMETGLMKRFIKNYLQELPWCLNPNTNKRNKNRVKWASKFTTLTITDLFTGFAILLTGIALCLLLFWGEFIANWLQGNHSLHNKQ